MLKPTAQYVLTAAEFAMFARTLESVKLLFGYASNLEKHIYNKKYRGLKLHNYHVLMQQLLPLTLKGLLQPQPRMVEMRICNVFCRICTKVYNPGEFQFLEANLAESMALLEMEFLPSFFDIMIHLPYHIVQELDMYGPMTMRWMYPMERYMKTLKNYIALAL